MKSLHNKVTAGMQKGFTLIELVIVIVIIGILAAVAIPNFSSLTTDAEDATARGVEGALKSQYSILLAKAKGTAPAFTAVLAAIEEPKCTAAGVCTAGTLSLTCVEGATMPSTIACTKTP